MDAQTRLDDKKGADMHFKKLLPILVLIIFAIGNVSTALAHNNEPRDFVIMKTPYRHLLASPLPTTPDGDVDVERLFVESSMTKKPNLTPEMEWYLSGVILALIEEDIVSAEQHVKDFIESTKNYRIPMDINSVIQWVLRQSYLETNLDLSYYASKVKYFNDAKKTLRDELEEAARIQVLKDCPPPGAGGSEICDDIENLISVLDDQFQATVIDERIAEGQMQFVLNQIVLERQNRNLQSLSNIAKLMFETKINLIRKLGDDDDD